jgi:hypothetical protein
MPLVLGDPQLRSGIFAESPPRSGELIFSPTDGTFFIFSPEQYLENGAAAGVAGYLPEGFVRIFTEHDPAFFDRSLYRYRDQRVDTVPEYQVHVNLARLKNDASLFLNLRSDIQAEAVSRNFYLMGSQSAHQTLREVLDDEVSVRSFGAVGDGVTSDSAAFQRAINEIFLKNAENFVDAVVDFYEQSADLPAAEIAARLAIFAPRFQRTIFVPAGRYVFTETVRVPSFVSIVGEDPTTTVLVGGSSFVSTNAFFRILSVEEFAAEFPEAAARYQRLVSGRFLGTTFHNIFSKVCRILFSDLSLVEAAPALSPRVFVTSASPLQQRFRSVSDFVARNIYVDYSGTPQTDYSFLSLGVGPGEPAFSEMFPTPSERPELSFSYAGIVIQGCRISGYDRVLRLTGYADQTYPELSPSRNIRIQNNVFTNLGSQEDRPVLFEARLFVSNADLTLVGAPSIANFVVLDNVFSDLNGVFLGRVVQTGIWAEQGTFTNTAEFENTDPIYTRIVPDASGLVSAIFARNVFDNVNVSFLPGMARRSVLTTAQPGGQIHPTSFFMNVLESPAGNAGDMFLDHLAGANGSVFSALSGNLLLTGLDQASVRGNDLHGIPSSADFGYSPAASAVLGAVATFHYTAKTTGPKNIFYAILEYVIEIDGNFRKGRHYVLGDPSDVNFLEVSPPTFLTVADLGPPYTAVVYDDSYVEINNPSSPFAVLNGLGIRFRYCCTRNTDLPSDTVGGQVFVMIEPPIGTTTEEGSISIRTSSVSGTGPV